jgi:hypothetical protein
MKNEVVVAASAFLEAAAVKHARGESAGCLDSALLRLLGAPSASWDGELRIPTSDHKHQAQIREVLPELLSAVIVHHAGETVNLSSILGALLLQPACTWEALQESPITALPFAAALLLFLETFDDGQPVDVFIAPGVSRILNAWTRPVAPWPEIPREEDVARAMFGDAWDLFLERTPGDGVYLADLVLREKPVFLPGLCNSQVVDVAVPLPGIDPIH